MEIALIGINGSLVAGLLALALALFRTRRTTCDDHTCLVQSVNSNKNRLTEIETTIQITRLAKLAEILASINAKLKSLNDHQGEISKKLQELEERKPG